ncbi:MAG: RNA polymerase sigma factor [Candidatus Paceibacterota bacterium]
MDKIKEEVIIRAYKDHERALLKQSFFKLGNRDLSDDLVQTTFLKTWEYLLKEDKIKHIKGFLFHILNNLIVDEYRKNKSISLDVLEEGGFQIAFDDSERLINQADGKTAMLLIPLLKEKHRKVVSMRFEEEKTIKEIAQITKQKNNTVVVQIRRGVDELAVLFRVDDKKMGLR